MIRPAARCATASTEAPQLAAQRGPDVLPAGLVEDDEVVILLLRPSLLFVPLSSFGSLTIIAVVTLLFALLAIRVTWLPWGEAQAYALGAAVASARLAWQTLDWWGRVYVLTDRRVIRRMGVLRVVVFEAPLRDLQHTSVFMPLSERVFGLGSIGFATAGSHVFDAFWVMIRQPLVAHKIVVETIQRFVR